MHYCRHIPREMAWSSGRSEWRWWEALLTMCVLLRLGLHDVVPACAQRGTRSPRAVLPTSRNGPPKWRQLHPALRYDRITADDGEVQNTLPTRRLVSGKKTSILGTAETAHRVRLLWVLTTYISGCVRRSNHDGVRMFSLAKDCH
ncbi:hypothetical protein BC628DRAFT_126112 [Trametes gibbosa]|nr:hypothetical protein BC628DRAFT_126112 [Trametes gibbosa]